MSGRSRSTSVRLPAVLRRFRRYIDQVEDARDVGNGFWVYLKPGWVDGSDPYGCCHQVHEDTPLECATALSIIRPCDCPDCHSLLVSPDQTGRQTSKGDT